MATEQLETLGTEDAKWLGEYSQVHMNVFGTPLRVMDHGEGAHIWDVDGNEYLDFLAGIAVNALGYAHPKWVKAVSEQAAKAAHVSNYFATEPQIKLAAKLVKLAGAPEGSRVYFGNSGAEGNEAALKLAKLYGRTLPGASPEIGGKPARIISMTHGFHGRTMGALSATWKPAIREKFEPLVPNIEFVEAGNVEALHDAFAETGQGKYGKGPVAAVIMELIQGEAGVMPLGADYVKAARKLCDEHKALLIIDEVQTGIGRTGAWFAFQREDLSGGVTPDIVTFAKGVGGGFPMGGMISFGAELSALFTPGSHGSNFRRQSIGRFGGIGNAGSHRRGQPRGQRRRTRQAAARRYRLLRQSAVRLRAWPWPARRHRTCPPLLACGHELGFGTRSHRQCGGSECVASRPAAGHHCSGRRSSGVHPRQDSVRPA
mgnify:CR=1 FL=1